MKNSTLLGVFCALVTFAGIAAGADTISCQRPDLSSGPNDCDGSIHLDCSGAKAYISYNLNFCHSYVLNGQTVTVQNQSLPYGREWSVLLRRDGSGNAFTPLKIVTSDNISVPAPAPRVYNLVRAYSTAESATPLPVVDSPVYGCGGEVKVDANYTINFYGVQTCNTYEVYDLQGAKISGNSQFHINSQTGQGHLDLNHFPQSDLIIKLHSADGFYGAQIKVLKR